MDVLLLDSKPSILEIAQALLASRGDRLHLAGTVEEAEVMLATGDIDVAIADPASADLIGYDLLGRSIRLSPETMRIAVMPSLEPAQLARVCNACRVHYWLCQPVSTANLNAALARAAEYLGDLHQLSECRRSDSEWLRFLEQRVTQQSEGIAQAGEDILFALVAALDIRENESAYHSRRVALYSLLFAVLLELDTEQYQDLYYGALLHDVGKIGIRDAVLLKPARLTVDERRHIQSHIDIGVRLLSEVKRFKSVLDIPRCHHECYDGSGYPAGLRGEAIPLAARMFALLDVYDALRCERPYKPSMSHEEAVTILQRGRDTHFDGVLLDRFCEVPLSAWDHLAGQVTGVRSFTEALLACHRVQPELAGVG